MASSPRVPGVMETARQPRYSMEQTPGSSSPTGVPVGIVDDVFKATPGTDGGDTGKIGTVTVTPSVKVCKVGDSFRLFADYSGNNQVGITYTWTVSANQGDPVNTFQPLTALGVANGSATATPAAQTHNQIEFNCVTATAANTPLTIQCEIKSTGEGAASDSGAKGTATVTINA